MSFPIRFLFVLMLFFLPVSAGAEDVPVGELSLVPPKTDSPVAARYQNHAPRPYEGVPSIAVSPSGRLWVSIMTGGKDEDIDNYVDLLTSDDAGETWSEPLFALDTDGPVRTIDPGLWVDPQGRLWWFFAQIYDFWDGRGGLWAMVCDQPDRADSPWHAPRRLCDGLMKNEPLVTSNGDWLMFVEHWDWLADADNPPKWFRSRFPDSGFEGVEGVLQGDIPEWFHFPDPPLGASVYRSTDQGETWNYLASIPTPKEELSFSEMIAIEKNDHTFRLLMRVNSGLVESESLDGGKTWSAVHPGPLKNPASRFYFARLKSGNVLLIKNGPLDVKTSRRDIIAYLSEDDGETFPYKLELDMRELPSYPNACQGTDGMIYAIHDYDRTGAGEVILDRFTEEDIKAGKLVSPNSRLHIIIRTNCK